MIRAVHKLAIFAISTTLISALGLTATARQTEGSPSLPSLQQSQLPGGRGTVQRGLANSAVKQPAQQPRNPPLDPAKRAEQKNKTANAIVDVYLGGFQKQVGLTDDQTRATSVFLGAYIRRQLTLADRRAETIKRLRELSDQQASPEELQAQTDQLDQTEKQLANSERKFYADINPKLTPPQRAKLKLYLIETNQAIRQAIQKSIQ